MFQFLLCMALATALHAAVFVSFISTGQHGGANEQGQAPVMIQTADADLIALVAEWQQVPEAVSSITRPVLSQISPNQIPRRPTEQLLPDIQMPAAPMSQGLSIPKVEQTPPPQPKRTSAAEIRETKPSAEALNQASTPEHSSQMGQRVSESQRHSALQEWGSRIRSQVASQQELPRNIKRNTSATVEITVSRSGRLLRVHIAKSSGDREFDRAALRSVQRAGRFPKAPAAITSPSETFVLPIRSR